MPPAKIAFELWWRSLPPETQSLFNRIAWKEIGDPRVPRADRFDGRNLANGLAHRYGLSPHLASVLADMLPEIAARILLNAAQRTHPAISLAMKADNTVPVFQKQQRRYDPNLSISAELQNQLTRYSSAAGRGPLRIPLS